MSTTPDILLINIGGTKKRVYQDLSKDFSAVEPPFWLLLTAGYLRKQGFNVAALDANVLNLDEEETVDAVVARKARLNAIVVYSQQANTCTPVMGGVSRLCRALKKRQADLPLILTGWHPSCLPGAPSARKPATWWPRAKVSTPSAACSAATRSTPFPASGGAKATASATTRAPRTSKT